MAQAPDEVHQAVESLASVPLFRGFDGKELNSIVTSSKTATFQTGESIVKEGDAGLGFYLILEGRALVKRRGKTIAKIGKGGFFGEMSLLDNQPRSAGVIAEEPTKCLVVLRWNFWSMVDRNSKVARELLQEMARRLRATDRALTE